MTVPGFSDILQQAIARKGSLSAVEANLPSCKSEQELIDQPDSFYLSTMSRRVFQAGLKHSLVNERWPEFESAFAGFDPYRNAMMSDAELDQHMANPKLIRHLGKLKSIRLNAAMVVAVARDHGSLGAFLSQWPTAEIVDLWLWLKKQGNQLGGMSGARFLRMAGKDTFLLTDDVVALLRHWGVVEKMPTSKRDLACVQAIFNRWRDTTGRPLCELSRIASYTINSP